jgi:hypothetical protein
MHTDLAGHLPVPVELSSVKIDNDDVGGPQEKLADTGRSDQQAMSIQPNGKIARGPRHKSQAVKQSAESDQIPSQLDFSPAFALHWFGPFYELRLRRKIRLPGLRCRAYCNWWVIKGILSAIGEDNCWTESLSS